MFEDLVGKKTSIGSTTYAIVHERSRTEFEKKWHVPFGYADCELFNNFEQAYKFLTDQIDINSKIIREYIIEQITNGKSDIVYPEITENGKRIYY
jgi:hypothetical protein